MEFLEEITSYLKCEYEVITEMANAADATKKYEELLALGKANGFTPLIIVPNAPLCEILEFNAGDGGNTMSESELEAINVPEFLSNRTNELIPVDKQSSSDIMGEFVDYESASGFISLTDYSTRGIYKTLLIAKLPTTKPWELALRIPMGGWNECPMPEEQAAVFKYWHEKYGAFPAVVQGDIWEMYVENPPRTQEEAVALAWEQFGFCSDIVWQGTETINALASTLINSKTWYFWWD